MSEGLGGHITKGRIHIQVDNYVNENRAKRGALITELKAADTAAKYFKILQDTIKVKPTETAYLRDTWYNEAPNGLFHEHQPIYRVLLHGLIKALEEAGTELPLESYWSPVGTRVETLIMRSAKQVTRIIVTPPGPAPRDARKKPVPMWVVRRRADGEVVPGETVDEVVVPLEGTIVISQMKEWEPPQP